MEYSYIITILQRDSSGEKAEEYIEIKSSRWYDRLFRTAVAIIWAMEELKSKVRGKE